MIYKATTGFSLGVADILICHVSTKNHSALGIEYLFQVQGRSRGVFPFYVFFQRIVAQPVTSVDLKLNTFMNTLTASQSPLAPQRAGFPTTKKSNEEKFSACTVYNPRPAAIT